MALQHNTALAACDVSFMNLSAHNRNCMLYTNYSNISGIQPRGSILTHSNTPVSSYHPSVQLLEGSQYVIVLKNVEHVNVPTVVVIACEYEEYRCAQIFVFKLYSESVCH